MTKTKGRPPTSREQIEHVLSLSGAGASPAEILAHSDTEVGLTTIYTILKYSKAPDSEQARGNSPTARDGNGGRDGSQDTRSA